MRRHEVDDFRRNLLRRNRQIAFIFAVLVIDDNQHPPGAEILQGLFDRSKWHVFLLSPDPESGAFYFFAAFCSFRFFKYACSRSAIYAL